MASNSSGRFPFLGRTAGQLRLAFAVAAAMIVASAAFADPIEVALVESSNSPSIEDMDYLRAGQIFRLAPHETIVLSYMSSCMKETITGGTVIIGVNQSEVRSGNVRRQAGSCYTGKVELTSAIGTAGGRALRGPPH
jgi:hypothetical protein